MRYAGSWQVMLNNEAAGRVFRSNWCQFLLVVTIEARSPVIHMLNLCPQLSVFFLLSLRASFDSVGGCSVYLVSTCILVLVHFFSSQQVPMDIFPTYSVKMEDVGVILGEQLKQMCGENLMLNLKSEGILKEGRGLNIVKLLKKKTIGEEFEGFFCQVEHRCHIWQQASFT
ncbi:hypothetical protein Pint_04845 [Pistacia integerrima]|uniref:Uncharacterized protein n=1 Tax=Pistacia integerrima TaxID=434235 RepID=A0ACC0Z4F5_9ROSI|nr:hypothetical protein Pint_04845 [Pistacia integerrima]